MKLINHKLETRARSMQVVRCTLNAASDRNRNERADIAKAWEKHAVEESAFQE